MKIYLHSRIYSILILTISLLAWSTYAYSGSFRINTTDLNSTPQQIRYASVRGLLNYNWQIKTIDNNLITAVHRNSNAEIKFLDDQTIEIAITYNSKWAENLKRGILTELKYYYYINQFDK